MPAHLRKRQKTDGTFVVELEAEFERNEQEEAAPINAFTIMENGLTKWGIGQGRDDPSMAVPEPDPNMRPLLLSLSNELLEMICNYLRDPATFIILGSTCKQLRDFVNCWGGIWKDFLPSKRDKPYDPKANYREEVLNILNRTSRSGCQICLRPRITAMSRGFKLRLCVDCFYQNSIPQWKGKLYNFRRLRDIRKDEKSRMRDVYHGWWIADVRRECIYQFGKSKDTMDAEMQAQKDGVVYAQNQTLQKLLEMALERDGKSPESPTNSLRFMNERLRRQHFVTCITEDRFGKIKDNAKKPQNNVWFDNRSKNLISWRPKGCKAGSKGDWCTGDNCPRASLLHLILGISTHRLSFRGCLPQATVQAALIFHTARIMATIWLRDRAAGTEEHAVWGFGQCPLCDQKPEHALDASDNTKTNFTPSGLAVHNYNEHGQLFWTRKDWFFNEQDGVQFYRNSQIDSDREGFWRLFSLPEQSLAQGLQVTWATKGYQWQHKGWIKEDVELYVETVERGFMSALDGDELSNDERARLWDEYILKLKARGMVPPVAIPEEPDFRSEFVKRPTDFA